MKLPSFQFYPGDWKKDPAVQSLTFHDRGVWFEMLILMFESPERGKLVLKPGVPMPESALARLLGIELRKLRPTLVTLLEFGVCQRDPESGAIFSKRMVSDEAYRNVRSEAGKLGGNPELKKNRNGAESQQNPVATEAVIPSISTDNFTPVFVAEMTGSDGKNNVVATIRGVSLSSEIGAELKVGVNQIPTTGVKVKPTPSSSSSFSLSSSTSPSVKMKETSFPFAPDGTRFRPVQAANPLGWSAEAGFSGITEKDRHRWKEAFPAVNLDRSIAAASEWLLYNPSRRKKHPGRFLSAWLSRDQERGGDLRAVPNRMTPVLNPQPANKLPWE